MFHTGRQAQANVALTLSSYDITAGCSTGWMFLLRSGEVETVQVHDFVPRRDKIV
jgi:hypothetical protein